MYKHAKKEHSENVENVKFDWKVRKTFKKPLKRQLYEAKCIDSLSEEQSLNSKDEFNGQTLRKLELAKKDKQFNCKVCGKLFNNKEDMRVHFKMFHERIKCNNCEYISYGEKDLMLHQKKHVQ